MAKLMETPQLEELSFRVWDMRTSRGWTQGQLAERSGIHLRTIVRIELGQAYPQLGTLRKLARGFDMPVGELISGPTEQVGAQVK